MDRDSKIVVLGLGMTGLSFSIRAATRGFETIGYESDEVKVAQLQQRESRFLDEEDADLFKSAKSLSITADESELEGADCFLICTSIPGELDELVEVVGRHLKEGALVVVESVVFPGVCEHVVLPRLEKSSGLSRKQFYFAHSPSRDAAKDTQRVIGSADRESYAHTAGLYRSMLGTNTQVSMTLKEAEVVPMVEDALTDMQLALANELAISFDRMGINISRVLEVAAPHFSYDGIERAKSSPNYFLTRAGNAHELDQPLLASARRTIERIPEYAVKVLSDALRDHKTSLKGATVALLGLSRQGDPVHGEDVSALKIRETLKKKGAIVKEFDPFMAGAGRDLREALDGAIAAIIATDYDMFCNLEPRHFEESGISIVVDARNCLDKDLFENSPVLYRGIGRG